MSSKNKWLLGARPKTLPAAIAPVAVGAALAKQTSHQVNLLNAALALLVSLALQIAVNYANDYSDGIRGSDEVRVGPVRLVGSGLATPAAVKRAAFIAFAVAGVAGSALALRTSPWLLLVGLVAIFAAWGYTGTSKPYGYRGLGELSVFIFFGLVATGGTTYAAARHLPISTLLFGSIEGALSCALLAINNIRDLPKDALVAKRTLAVRLGEAGARKFYTSLLASPFILILAYAVTTNPRHPYLLASFVLAPMAWKITSEVRSGLQGAALIPLLAKTAKLQLWFSTIIALALLR